MKKKKYMKRLASFLMAAVLLGNQVTTTSIAQATEYELSGGEARMESGGTDTLESGPIDDSQLSDGKLLSGEKQSPASAEESTKEGKLSDTTESVSVFDVKEVNALLIAVPSEEAPNTWKLRAEWTAGKLQDETVRLALVLDSFTYEALSADEKADKDEICHILTAEGERVSLRKETDETRPDDILLVYDQTGDGSLKLEFSFSAENVLEETNSSITAEWCEADTSWTVLDKKEILWQKTLGEEFSESDGTEEGEPTENETTEMIPAEAPQATPIENPEAPEATPIENPEAPQTASIESSEETEITPTVNPEDPEGNQSEEQKDVTKENQQEPEITPTEELEEPETTPTTELSKEIENDEGDLEETSEFMPALFSTAVRNVGSTENTSVFLSYVTRMEFYQIVNGTWVKVVDGNFADENAGDALNGIKASIEYTLPAGTLKADGAIEDRSVKFNLSELSMRTVVNESGTVYDGSTAVGTYSINKDTGDVVIIFDSDFAAQNADAPVYGTLRFEAKWKDSSSENDSSITLTYGDNTTITVWPDGVPGDISARKSFGSYDFSTGLVTYNLEVTSQKGTSSTVQLVDSLTGFVSEEKMAVKSVNKNGISLNAGSASNGGYETSNVSNSGITVTLPQMAANDKYEIQVTAKVPAGQLFNDGISIDNNLTASSANKKNETITSTGNLGYTINNNMFTKTGWTDKSENGKPIIRWKIVINSNHVDLTGMVLKDSMLANANGITVTPDNGYTHAENSDSITFTSVSNEQNTNEYTIEYYTEITDSPGIGKTISTTNTVELGKEGGPSQKKDVTVNYNVTWISKTGAYDAAHNRIDWVITVNQDGQNIAGASLTDTLFEQLEESAITITHADGNSADTGEYHIVKTYGGKIDKITFNVTDSNKNENKNTYLIKYSTSVSDEDIRNGTASNEGTITGPDGGSAGTGSVGVNVSAPNLEKSGGWDSYNKIINWTVRLNDNFASLTGQTFADTFNEANDGTLTGNGKIKIYNKNNPWNPAQEIEIVLDHSVSSGQYSAEKGTGENSEKDVKVKVSDIAGIAAYVNTFWASGNSDYAECKYEISYSTAVDITGEKTITNKASLGSKEVSCDVPVSAKPEKSAGNIETLSSQELSNDGTLTGSTSSEINRINWTAKLPIPHNGIAANTTYYDYPDNGQWFSVAELNAHGTDLTTSVTIGSGENSLKLSQGTEYILYLTTDVKNENAEKSWISWSDAQNTPNTKYYGFKIVMNTPVDGSYCTNPLQFHYTTLIDLETAQKDSSGNYPVRNEISLADVISGGTGIGQTVIESSFSKNYTGDSDYNGNAKSNGLKWSLDFEIASDMSGKVITIEDTLPDKIAPNTKDTVTFKFRNLQQSVVMKWKESEDGSLTGNAVLPVNSSFVEFQASYKDGKITVTINTENSANLPQGDRCIIEYSASSVDDSLFKNVAEESPVAITNKATLSYDGKSSEVTNSKNIIKVETTPEVVKKEAVLSGVKEADKTYIPYRVLINPEAKDLIPGKDVVSMKDILSYPNWDYNWNYTADLEEQTVKLYYGEMDGEEVIKTGEVPNSLWGFVTSTNGNKDAPEYYINLEVPDETFLILEYTYAIEAEEKRATEVKDTTLEITNKAELYGTSDGNHSSEDKEKYNIHESSATARTSSVTFYKIRKGAMNQLLEGAEFDLYKWDAANKKWSKASSAKSDTDGKLTFETGFAYEEGVPYYLRETKAPDGFLLDTVHYHFYISDDEITFSENVTCGVCGENMILEQIPRGTKTYLENEIIPQTKVSVKKEWKDIDGNTITPSEREIDVQLYQVKGTAITQTENPVTVKVDGVSYRVENGSWLELTIQNGWGAGDYYIKVDNALGNNQQPDAVSTTSLSGTTTKVYRIAVPGETTVGIIGTNCGNFSVTDYKVYPAYKVSGGSPAPYGEKIALSNSNNWSYDWKNLPQYTMDESGNICPYMYYVQENSIEGYLTQYTYLNPSTGKMETAASPGQAAAGSYTVTNIKKEEVSVTVNKTWSDSGTKNHSTDSVTVQLYSSTKDFDLTDDYTGESEKKITLTAAESQYSGKTLAEKVINGSKATVKVAFNYDIANQNASLFNPVDGIEIEYVKTVKEGDNLYYFWFNVKNITEDCELKINNGYYPLDNSSTPSTIEQGNYIEGDIESELSAVGETITLTGDKWTYSWKNLNNMSEDGQKLYYYVKETSSTNGYTAFYKYSQKEDGSQLVNIRNVKDATKNISVHKSWSDPADASSVDNWAEMQLYSSTEELDYTTDFHEPTRTITFVDYYSNILGSREVSYSRAKLVLKFYSWDNVNENTLQLSDEVTVKYIKTEVDAAFKYLTFNLSDIPDAGCILKVNSNPLEISVENGWYNPDVTLTPIGGSVRLTSGSWDYTWGELPVTDAEGNELFYYVNEVDSSVSGENYTQQTKYTFADTYTTNVEITNVAPPKKQIKVNKVWSDGNGHEGQSVEVQLYKSTEEITIGSDGNPVAASHSVIVNSRTAQSLINCAVKSSCINIWLPFNNEYDYNLNGNLTCNGVSIKYADAKSKDSYYYKIYNITGLKDASYTFEYDQWTSSSQPALVYEGLYDPEGNTSEYNPLTSVPDSTRILNADNNWTYEWTDLDYYTDYTTRDTELYYYVMEVGISDDSTCYSASYDYGIDENGTRQVTITNTPTTGVTDVTVTKKWKGYTDSGGNSMTPSYRVTLQLMQNSIAYGESIVLDGITDEKEKTAWTYSWTGLPETGGQGEAYHYTVKEVKVEDISDSSNPAEVSDYTADYSLGPVTDGKCEIIITNRPQTTDLTSLSVKKNWVNLAGHSNPAEITVSLYKSSDQNHAIKTVCLGNAHASDSDKGYSEDGWKYTWSDLEALPDGEYYYVAETPVEGYKTTYRIGTDEPSETGSHVHSVGNGETIDITNTELVDIKVQKKWEGYEADEISSYTVQVVLQRSSDNGSTWEEADTKSLKSADADSSDQFTWSQTWTGLDPGYTYSVKEVKVTTGSGQLVENFAARYSVDGTTWYDTSSEVNIRDGDGTITIKNIKNKQGITLPGTGSKYPFVFYGSGLAFMLIAWIWLVKAFKRKNIPIDTGKGGNYKQSDGT